MNASIIFVFALVACAAAYVPVYDSLEAHVPDYQREAVTVSKSTTVGHIPYSHDYPLSQTYGYGYYPYHRALFGQYYRYPYYNQYHYGYPYTGLNSYFSNIFGASYGKGYPHYGYGYQYPVDSYYTSGYHHYPYYHYGYNYPSYHYGYNYPSVY